MERKSGNQRDNFFKTLLRKIFPPSVNTFNLEMHTLKEELHGEIEEQCDSILNEVSRNLQQCSADVIEKILDQYGKAMAEAREEIALQLRQIEDTANVIPQQIYQQSEQLIQEQCSKLAQMQAEEIQKCTDMVLNVAERGKIRYYCPHEVRAIESGGFYKERESPDYLTRYQALVAGLDKESIDTINQILTRHLLVKNCSEEHLDLFSTEEQSAIRKQRENFYATMPEIEPGVFACGEYLLAIPATGMGFAETTIFVDHAGFDKLHHLKRIRERDVLDLGAFIGDSALVLSKYTDKTVYAFEPGRSNFEAMEKTLRLNGCKNIVPVQAGIGSSVGEAKVSVDFSMGLTIDATNNPEQKDGVETVPVISVDEYVQKHHLQVGLIKVDIEGYEQEFLKGAEQTIKQQRPALLLSMYHNASDFFGLKPILESWGLGYRFQVHKEVNEHIHYDTMLIAEVDDF